MIISNQIASIDQVVIYEVTGLPHTSNVNVEMENKVDELIDQYQRWTFNRYKCVGNPVHELVIFHKRP